MSAAPSLRLTEPRAGRPNSPANWTAANVPTSKGSATTQTVRHLHAPGRILQNHSLADEGSTGPATAGGEGDND